MIHLRGGFNGTFLRAGTHRNLAADPRGEGQCSRARSERYLVRGTPNRGLRQVGFIFEDNEIRALEQNPRTKSRWAQLARSGKKVMQFLRDGRYVANVVDGKVTLYGGRH